MSEAPDTKRPAFADTVASALTIVLFVANLLVDVDEPLWLTLSGVVFLLLALTFFVPPFFHLTRLGEPKDGEGFYATSKLVDKGLYGIVRHPQYLGYTMLLFGLAFTDPHPIILGCAVVAAGFFYSQCVQEERYCLR